jgi:hypothetical protein
MLRGGSVMNVCSVCEEPLDDLECHHHSTSTEATFDAEYTVCDDCPAWWPLKVGLS